MTAGDASVIFSCTATTIILLTTKELCAHVGFVDGGRFGLHDWRGRARAALTGAIASIRVDNRISKLVNQAVIRAVVGGC